MAEPFASLAPATGARVPRSLGTASARSAWAPGLAIPWGTRFHRPGLFDRGGRVGKWQGAPRRAVVRGRREPTTTSTPRSGKGDRRIMTPRLRDVGAQRGRRASRRVARARRRLPPLNQSLDCFDPSPFPPDSAHARPALDALSRPARLLRGVDRPIDIVEMALDVYGPPLRPARISTTATSSRISASRARVRRHLKTCRRPRS